MFRGSKRNNERLEAFGAEPGTGRQQTLKARYCANLCWVCVRFKETCYKACQCVQFSVWFMRRMSFANLETRTLVVEHLVCNIFSPRWFCGRLARGPEELVFNPNPHHELLCSGHSHVIWSNHLSKADFSAPTSSFYYQTLAVETSVFRSLTVWLAVKLYPSASTN